MILQKVTDENDSVALVGTRLHPFRFGDVERQRFLDKNILAGIDAAERQRAMSSPPEWQEPHRRLAGFTRISPNDNAGTSHSRANTVARGQSVSEIAASAPSS